MRDNFGGAAVAAFGRAKNIAFLMVLSCDGTHDEAANEQLLDTLRIDN